MDYEDAIRDAVTYPVRGDDWIGRVAVGGGIVLLTLVAAVGGWIGSVFALTRDQFALGFVALGVTLLVPMATSVVILGYLVRVARTSLEGGDELPPWGNAVELVVEGTKASLVVLAYQAVAAVGYGVAFGVFFVFGAGVGSGAAAGSEGAVVEALGLFYPIFVGLSMVVSLVVGYFTLVSVLTYAHRGSVRAALSPAHVRRVAFSKEFAVTFLLGYAGQAVAGNLVWILVLVLIGFFALFALYVAMFRLFAAGYAEALGLASGAAEAGDGVGEATPTTGDGEFRRADAGGRDA